MTRQHTLSSYTQNFTKVFADHAHFGLMFGSCLTDRFGSESDIDIAVYPHRSVDAEKLHSLTDQFIDLCDREVDCIDLRTSDPIITMQALSQGKLVFCDSKDFFDQYKATKISQYIDFKQSRKFIEDNLIENRITPRGSDEK